MRRLYLVFALAGLILPFAVFAPYTQQHGLDLARIVDEALATEMSRFIAADLFIALLAFWVYVYRESRRHGYRWWWLFILATAGIGFSFAVPAFFYVREGWLSQARPQGKNEVHSAETM